MTQTAQDPRAHLPIPPQAASLADELRGESDRLRGLADAMHSREQALLVREAALTAREKELEEMIANYPFFKKAVHGWLIEKARREVQPLPPDTDLATWAKEHGGVPLESFLDDL